MRLGWLGDRKWRVNQIHDMLEMAYIIRVCGCTPEEGRAIGTMLVTTSAADLDSGVPPEYRCEPRRGDVNSGEWQVQIRVVRGGTRDDPMFVGKYLCRLPTPEALEMKERVRTRPALIARLPKSGWQAMRWPAIPQTTTLPPVQWKGKEQHVFLSPEPPSPRLRLVASGEASEPISDESSSQKRRRG